MTENGTITVVEERSLRVRIGDADRDFEANPHACPVTLNGTNCDYRYAPLRTFLQVGDAAAISLNENQRSRALAIVATR